MDPLAHRRWTFVHRAFGLGLLSLATALGPTPSALACDVCAVYTATEQSENRTGPRLGVAVQYSHFGTLKDDSHEVPNTDGQYLNSVITQVVMGYQVTPRIGLQLNLPLISRQYRRPVDGKNQRGNVSGPGDMSLLANVLAHSFVTESSVFRFTLLGGLKLPTGDPEFLGEELAEVSAAGVRRAVPRHTAPEPGNGSDATHAEESGIHGHDLALGSGSVDGLVGGDLFWSYQRAFLSAGMQYAIRTEGSFSYRFANELSWAGGPGAYVLLEHNYSLAVQALLAGETKGKDHQAGVSLGDTAVTNLFVGPRLLFSWGTSLSAEASVELPVYQHETELQIVSDYRVRAAAVWRF